MAASTGVASAQKTANVLLVVREDQRVRLVDPDDLSETGALLAPEPVHRATPASDSLFVELMPASTCCTLSHLDLETLTLQRIDSPTGGGAFSGDGRFVLNQRGNIGIDVFDARTFECQTNIVVKGLWKLFSGGPLVLGISDEQEAALFDAQNGRVKQSFPLAGGGSSALWLNGRYVVVSFGDAHIIMSTLDPNESSVQNTKEAPWPGFLAGGRLGGRIYFRLLEAEDRLFLYELFGFIGDRRERNGASLPGGLLELDLTTGAVVRHIAPQLHLRQAAVIPGRGGRVYVLDEAENRRNVSLIELDDSSGAILQVRSLGPGNWDLTAAAIPTSLVRRESVLKMRTSTRTETCGRR